MSSSPFLVFSSLLMLVVSLLLTESFTLLEIYLTGFPYGSLSISFLLDSSSLMFLMTVLMIYLSVLIYSLSYMSSEVYLSRFLAILMMFVVSMFVLIMSSSLLTSLVGWDGLGTTSLFLILFYYSNSSMKAATLTFLMNRTGDCMFIMALTNVLLMGESCLACLSEYPLGVALLLLATSMTKSAQIPFSSWLPAAMEAPTPVSALVHSSTLVTAGIYILYRYSSLWMPSSVAAWALMVLSLSTCLMAGLSGLVENDLKKLIALSTLSQLGFIMFSFSLGLLDQGFTHMLMHAFFKALLFLCAGLLIHSFNGVQTLHLMSVANGQSPLVIVAMSTSLSSMMGLPFLSGFYSKDLILDAACLDGGSIAVFACMVVSFMLTAMYSVRAIWYLLNGVSGWNSMSDSDFGMLKPMAPMAGMATLGGSAVGWLSPSLSLTVGFPKTMLLLSILTVIAVYWAATEIFTNRFMESKWFLSSLNLVLSKGLFSVARFYKMSSDLQGLPELLNKALLGSAAPACEQLLSSVKSIFLGNAETLAVLLMMTALHLSLVW